MPGLTILFVGLSDAMRAYWPVAAALLLVVGAALFFFRRKGTWGRIAEITLALTAATMCAGALVGVTMPLVSLLEGICHRR